MDACPAAQIDGLMVEETTLDQWLICQFRSAQHAPARAVPMPAATRPTARPAPRRFQMRALHWCWLAGALGALALYL